MNSSRTKYDPEAKDFAKLLKDAARQRRFMLPWQADRRLIAEGGHVLYTVDVDVIKLYTNPNEMAVATDRRKEGYAQVFHSDPPAVSVALGRRLARKIFFELGRGPLLVLPPLDEEVRVVFNAILKDVQNEQKRTWRQLAALREKVAQLDSVSDRQELAQRLEDEALELATLVSAEHSASAELRRFSQLMDKERIMPLDRAWEAGLIDDPALREACTPPSGFIDWLRFHEITENWKVLLRQTKSPRQKTALLDRDAHALARLEWINQRLEPHRHQRVVLITGDAALEKAARSYWPKGAKHDFADLYLRHPRAYLGEPDVLDSGDDGDPAGIETELTLWLDALLARSQVSNHPYRTGLDKLLSPRGGALVALARPITAEHPGIIRDILDRWTCFTRNLVLNQGVIDDPAAVGELARLRGDLKRLLDGVSMLLRRRVRETWWETLGVISRTGYALLFSCDPKRLRPRTPPILSYDSFPKAETLAHLLFSTHTWNTEAYRKVLGILDEEDASNYTYFLALATLFAAEGIWPVAAGLAGEAIEIAETHHPEHISGREAAYVRAVALRYTARHTRELAVAASFLNDAKRYLEEDRVKRGRWYDAGEIRFNAEEQALYLTYHQFCLFLDQPIPLEAGVPELVVLHNQLTNVLADLEKSQARPLIKNVVKRELLINLLQVALLRWDEEGESVQRIPFIPVLEALENNIDKYKETIQITFRDQAILLAAQCWLAEDKTRKKDKRRKLERYLSDSAIKKHSVQAFDRFHFPWLRNLIKP